METKEANQKLYETNQMFFNEIANKVLLSVHNPRYRTIKSIEINLCERLKEDAFNTDQEKVCQELLKNEEDLFSLLTLLQNIKEMGFDSSTDRLIFLKMKDINNNHKYVVAEGNRRMLCLKLLFGYVNLQSLDWFLINNNFYHSKNSEKYKKLKTNEENRIKSNFTKIQRIIQEFKARNQKSDYENKEFWFEITNDSKFLWSRIFGKHINGQSSGLKQWSRGSYFINLINFFKDGFPDSKDTKKIKDCEIKLQKAIGRLKDDFKEAQIVYWIVSSDAKTEKEIENYMFKTPVSALQKEFWTKLIKNTLTQIGCDWGEYKNQFSIEWKNNKTELDKVNSGISAKNLNFIKEWHIRGIITTRSDLNSKKEKIFRKALKELLEIEKSNGILNEAQLQKMVEINELAKNLVKKWKNKLQGIVLDTRFTLIIVTLFKQLEHNSNQTQYGHAMASTIRTLLELFIIFGYVNHKYEDDDSIEKAINKNVKEIDFIDDSWTSAEKLVYLMGTDDFDSSEILYVITQKYSNNVLKSFWSLENNENKKILSDLAECWCKKKQLDKLIHRLHYLDDTIEYLEKCVINISAFVEKLDKTKFSKIIKIGQKMKKFWTNNDYQITLEEIL